MLVSLYCGPEAAPAGTEVSAAAPYLSKEHQEGKRGESLWWQDRFFERETIA